MSLPIERPLSAFSRICSSPSSCSVRKVQYRSQHCASVLTRRPGMPCDADPMITTTLFRVPQCQSLGPSAAYHEDDYTVSCTSSGFYAAVTFSVVMIFLIPIGVPLVFLMLMYRAKSSLPDGRPNSTMLGGAKLCRRVTNLLLSSSHRSNRSSVLEVQQTD